MARQLLIYINKQHPQLDDRLSWLVLNDGQVAGSVMQGTLAEAAAMAVNTQVTIVVPAESVYLTRQALPGKNRQRLMQAVPFALEEQLADDVEEMHFALGTADSQDRYWIAAVAQQQMDQWLSLFKAAGINPRQLIPDLMLIEAVGGQIRIWCEAQRALLVLPDQRRVVVDTQNLPLVLNKIMQEDESGISTVECFTDDRSLELEKLIAEPVKVEVNAHITSPLLLMAKAMGRNLPINLVQGRYSHRERRQHRFQAWYPAAAMVAIWIVAQLVVAGIDNFRYSRQLDDIRARQQQVFQQAFPTSKAAGDVFRRMESELKRLKQKRGAADAGFYGMLTTLAPALGASADLQLQSMRYHEGRIDLELRLPTLQSLDQLKATLASQPQWQVDIQSASSAKEHVEARLQIRSGT